MQAATGTTNIYWADTVTSLRGLAGGTDYVAILLGYTAPGDGGGGIFVWNTASLADDDGTIFNSNNPDGGYVEDGGTAEASWCRVYSGPLDVKWFGAKGDGSTADDVAINNAVKAAKGATAVPGSRAVFFPPGTYRCTNTISLDGIFLAAGGVAGGFGLQSVTLDGAGAATLIYDPPSAPAGGALISCVGSMAVVLRGLSFGCVSASFTNVLVLFAGTTALDSSNHVIEDCFFTGGYESQPSTPSTLLQVQTIYTVVRNCIFRGGKYQIVGVSAASDTCNEVYYGSGNMVRLENCLFYAATAASVYNPGAVWALSGCSFTWGSAPSTGDLYGFSTSGSNTVYDLTFTECYFGDSVSHTSGTRAWINVVRGEQIVIQNCWVGWCGYKGSGECATSDYCFRFTTCQNVVIQGNYFGAIPESGSSAGPVILFSNPGSGMNNAVTIIGNQFPDPGNPSFGGKPMSWTGPANHYDYPYCAVMGYYGVPSPVVWGPINTTSIYNAGTYFLIATPAGGTTPLTANVVGSNYFAMGNYNLANSYCPEGYNQPTITGSKGGNAALASLLTALGPTGLNLILDNTT